MSPEVIAVPSLASWPVFVLLAETPWLLALVKALHLLGVTLLVGPVVAFDLRLLGIARQVPIGSAARLLLPLAVASVVLIVPSGLALFGVHSEALLSSGVFMMKMGLLLAGATLAIAFHAGPWRTRATWDAEGVPRSARLCASGSIAGWLGVIGLACALLPP